MPIASLPGLVGGLWHLGPVRLDGYALCVVLGLVVLLWVAEHRYRAIGGRPWLIVDMATVAVPVGLVAARLYRVVDHYQWYFGHDHDWVDIFRIADGGLSMPAGLAGGLAAAWVWCRRSGIATGPVLSAAAPGLAFGQAIDLLGNWFSQSLYGQPSTWPWAIAISPWHRAAGYQNYSTFQPLFGYEAIWDVMVGLVLIRLIRTMSLTGGRALALCAALYAAGRLATASLQLVGPHQQAGIRFEQAAAIGLILGASAYLYRTRAKRAPEPLISGAPRRPLGRFGAPGGVELQDIEDGVSRDIHDSSRALPTWRRG